jgi:7-cyano-7-deazaguanine synthase
MKHQPPDGLNGPPAVVLLSGGLDSATALAAAKADGYQPYALTVSYGQRHHIEVEAARRVAAAIGAVRHVVTDLDLGVFGGSALTDDIEVPKDSNLEEIGNEIPVTYVPARNTIFLALALAWAEVLEAADIFIGVNALDYSGYPDCRPEFIGAFEGLAQLATKAGAEGRVKFTIHTPLIELSKREIILQGTALGVDYEMTLSCYDPSPDGAACGRCDACALRRQGFLEAGLSDPTRYQAGVHAS